MNICSNQIYVSNVIFFQLNYQRDQVAAIKDKQQEKEETDTRELSQVQTAHMQLLSVSVYLIVIDWVECSSVLLQTELDDTKSCYQLIETVKTKLNVLIKIKKINSWECFDQDAPEKEI